MTETLPARSETELVDGNRRSLPWRQIGLIALGVWALALALEIYAEGVPLDRESILAWLLTGIGLATVGRRSLWTLVRDWLPFIAFLFAYDFARGAAVSLSGYAIWTPQIDAERALFGGTIPTVWLQSHFKQAFAPWWEVVTTLTYSSFFLVPYLVAGLLWIRSRSEFRRWVARFLGLSFAGVAVFIAMPAAPPWAASICSASEVSGNPVDPSCIHAQPHAIPGGGLLDVVTPSDRGAAPYVERLTGRGWEVLHLDVAKTLLQRGQAGVDLVAAIPSLHGATSMLVVIFFWHRTSRRLRPLLLAYPVVMGFSLVYTGEHYVVDVLAGWLIAALVCAGVGRLEARRDRVVPPVTLGVRHQ